MIPVNNYHINSNKIIKFATNMTKNGAFLPIVLLETTVVGGRTYQAYKRGGWTEARERVLEETTGSFVWLGGAPLLGKLGNYLGEKIVGLNPNFDIGKDNLRNPLEYILNTTKGATKQKYAGFKFANTLLSVFVAAGFLGFIVPKLNQKLTRFLYHSNKQQKSQIPPNQQSENKDAKVELPQIKPAKTIVNIPKSASNAMDKFMNDIETKKKSPSFKGFLTADQIATLTHNLDNDAVYKLLSIDSVVYLGRGTNARNADECREILFRDISSSFFYLFASFLVIKGLTALDNKLVKGNTNIDPYSAMKIHNYLLDTMPKEKMTQEEFAKFATGMFNSAEFERLKGLKLFDKFGIMTLESFKKSVTNKELQDKAVEMSKMQPLKNGVAILTEQQVKNILTDGKMADPKLLKDVLNNIFGSLDTKEDVLANPTKFIARKDIEKSVDYIQDYVKSILEYAKKHNISEITPEMLLKVNKRNLNHRIGFMAAGFITAAAFLSTIIPKVQYYITKVKTGSNQFPGARNLDEAA